MEALMNYNYPGNVRELENVIERTVALESGAAILPESLPPVIFHPGGGMGMKKDFGAEFTISADGISLESIVGDMEKALLEKALKKAGGVKKKAAKLLGISFRSIRYRLEKHGME